MELADVSLDDKYTKADGRIFLTGIQALVRLPMLQRQRDLAAGHDTAGYVTGYRGSPLGGLDQQLAAARRFLDQHHIKVQTAVNEDLAATALWGTQQAQLFGEGRYDGVFGMWYGKGPGVDRTGDAFRHGNLAGTAPLGGVLALMGDDHTCKSSTTAHQSEYAMVDAMMPIANPAGVAEILQFGLLGFALSRYAGCWVGLKCVHDTVNTAASIDLEGALPQIRLPDDHELPPGGLSIRWPDTPLAQEERLHRYKLEAARAFARANRFDRLVLDSPRARLGIVTTGKSYLDVRQALDDLGIDREVAARLGLRLLKLGLVWPLDASAVQAFAQGLEQIVVVEEKRGLIETQLKELLYGRAPASIVGKEDEEGKSLFPSYGALSSNRIARVLAERILRLDPDDRVAARLAALGQRDEAEARLKSPILRTPYFCPGCPHNTSTRVPEGSIAKAGIGCHYMAQWMDRSTAGFTQMGAEGANWIGEAPFSKRDHVFQNLGDGTYYHSGLLAIRAAVAAGVKVTYKILFNDAVAMTGGQQVDGPLSVPQITRQVLAEGVTQVVVVTDEPEKYPMRAGFGEGVTIRHRDDLDDVQRTLREIEGTTVLIYDQTCAAEKRRRRKRGQMVDPERRVLINEAVCEGCGDCGLASNCAAIVPVETEFGRKRQIDQSSCNKDYSCLNGFCPSFVTVAGARLKKGRPTVEDDDQAALPEPALPDLAGGYGIVIGGVGGTGVVTIGALLGMAAHLEGKGAAVLDMTGLAQKGGAVMSHLRIAASPAAIQTVRIAPGGARLLLGCDLVVAGGKEALASLAPEHGHAVVNSHEMMTGDFTRNADFSLPDGGVAPRDRADRGRARPFRAGDPAGERSPGRCDRDQPVHGRLRLSAGPAAGFLGGNRARDRDQPGRGRDEPQRVPLGPARRAGPRGGRGGGGAASCGCRAVTDPRRADRAARGASRGLSGRRLRGALSPPGRAGARRRCRARPERAQRGGRPLPCQAHGLQGRVRDREALCRRRVHGGDRPPLRGSAEARAVSGAAPARPARSGDRAPEEATLRAMDLHCAQISRAAEGPARPLARSVRPYRGPAYRAPPDRRLRAGDRGAAGPAVTGQLWPRGRDRADPGADPRLRPRQAAPSGGRQAPRGGASGRLPRTRCRADRRCLRRDQPDVVDRTRAPRLLLLAWSV